MGEKGEVHVDWRGYERCRAEAAALAPELAPSSASRGSAVALMEAALPEYQRQAEAARYHLESLERAERAALGSKTVRALGLLGGAEAPRAPAQLAPGPERQQLRQLDIGEPAAACGPDLALLASELEDARLKAARAHDAIHYLEADVVASRRWAGYESGRETRDVLENGIRRADMEARFGRPVTLADVTASMSIPIALRPRLIGAAGKERYEPSLSWDTQPFVVVDVPHLSRF